MAGTICSGSYLFWGATLCRELFVIGDYLWRELCVIRGYFGAGAICYKGLLWGMSYFL